MNDISKFNGQYLKCIVTKYDSTFLNNKYLANSGALIIYQPNSKLKVNRNYIYLGNEFLASGYGFSTEEKQKIGERIVDEYDSTIAALKKADEDEANTRHEEDEKIWNNFNNYVAIKGGPINDTIAEIQGIKVRTHDILLYGEEAKYQNLTINDIKLSINGINAIDNNIYIPLGSKINYIEVDIYYDINDSGGIDKIEVLHKNLNYVNYINSETNENIETVIIKYDEDDHGNSSEGHIKYKKIFNDDNPLYVTDNIIDIISGFYIYINETPEYKYKNYPMLEKAKKIKIKSIGNIISYNRVVVLKNINVIPTYNLYYNFLNKNDEITPYSIINNAINLNTNKDINIIINSSHDNNTFYFAIPSIYHLNKLYATNENNEKHNWTGSVSKLNNSIKLITNYKNNDDNIYVTDYDIYKICDNNNFTCNQFILYISLNNELNYNNITRVSYINSAAIDFSNSSNINDEEFNSLYWVNLKQNGTQSQIKYILNPIISNCASIYKDKENEN